MLKYVNTDFQISDLKTGNLVIVEYDAKIETTLKKLNVVNNGMYLEPLNPKWHEKIISLCQGCKVLGKVISIYRDV